MAEALKEAKRRVNRTSHYTPYGAAKLAFESTEPEVLVSGPSRTGKTRGWLEKIHYLMETYSNARCLIARKTRASLSETVLQTFEDYVLGDQHYLNTGTDRAHRTSYRYNNGSVIVVGGLDKATRILSSEYDIIYVPEAIELTIEDWETLITRLSGTVLPYKQLVADTNPDKPTHWLKQRCENGITRYIFSDHTDNPLLYDRKKQRWTTFGEQYISRLDKLTGPRRARLRFGKWVQAEGVIYETYDEQLHRCNWFEIPKEWPRYRVIDFGYTNPFVCQWWTVDPDGALIRYREIYMSGRTVKKHAELINKLSEGENIVDTICDHDAEDRATLAENGIKTKPAKKEVKVGIEKVQDRLLIPDNHKARLILMRDALVEIDSTLKDAGKPICTEEEITGYVWASSSDGRPVKEEPQKLEDHGMDAMRYLVMKIDGQGKVRADNW